MSSPLVLDSSALLAITLHETGDDFVLTQIRSASAGALVHSVNVFEIVYKLVLRGIPEDAAWEAATFGGIEIVDDAGEALTKRAIHLKVNNLHLSMGDCYCVALAESVQGRVLTSDKGFDRAKTVAEVIQFRD